MGDLTKHFSRSEFACKCGCGFDDISMELVDILDWVREFSGYRIDIDSGCRCREYNKAKGFSKTSSHITGLAADIICTNSRKRIKVITLAIGHVSRIGIEKSFVHLDIDDSKPQDAMWLY